MAQRFDFECKDREFSSARMNERTNERNGRIDKREDNRRIARRMSIISTSPKGHDTAHLTADNTSNKDWKRQN